MAKGSLDRDDYVIGTHELEVARLALQHRVWRPCMEAAWRHAGIIANQRVADLGAGPGYATFDLAAGVGPAGHVYALERSARFLEVLRTSLAARPGAPVTVLEVDLEAAALPVGNLDATWCRWVLSFLHDPAALVRRIAASLRPGGAAVFHEYLDYRAWRGAPALPGLDRFVEAVIASWRAHGGDADVGRRLPAMLEAAGLVVERAVPLAFFPRPGEPMWEWLTAFITGGSARLVELGEFPATDNATLQRQFAEFASRPGSRMLTPTVLEVVARRP